MKRYILFLILSLVIITSLVGCKASKDTNPTVSSTTKDVSKDASVLTLEKIKEKYKIENIGQIIKTYDYKNYILVEYLNEVSMQCFDLYNLK